MAVFITLKSINTLKVVFIFFINVFFTKKEIYNPLQCPCCKKETMQTLLRFNRRGPPDDWMKMAKNILECIV